MRVPIKWVICLKSRQSAYTQLLIGASLFGKSFQVFLVHCTEYITLLCICLGVWSLVGPTSCELEINKNVMFIHGRNNNALELFPLLICQKRRNNAKTLQGGSLTSISLQTCFLWAFDEVMTLNDRYL